MPTEDQPVTPNQLIKWASIICSAACVLVTIIWFFASLKSDIASQRQASEATKVEQNLKIDGQAKELEHLKGHLEATDREMDDMGRKLDVCVAILSRIEKQVSENK